MNETMYKLGEGVSSLNQPIYLPPKECVDWCVVQKVTGFANLEIYTVAIVAVALSLLIAYEMMMEHEELKKHAPMMVFLAKLAIYCFFYVYFFYVRGGV